MSVVVVEQPKLAVRCDHCGIEGELTVDWLDGWSTRRAARRQGWQVRPARGPGSRIGPDVCPACQSARSLRRDHRGPDPETAS